MFRNIDGENLRIYRYEAPDFFGEVELLTDYRQPLPIIAVEDCRVSVISAEETMKWLRTDFSFCLHVMRRLCEKMYDDMYSRTDQRFLTQKQRLLKAYQVYAGRNELETLTKQTLCEELGIPLRSLNRIIAQCSDTVVYEKKRFRAVKRLKGEPRGLPGRSAADDIQISGPAGEEADEKKGTVPSAVPANRFRAVPCKRILFSERRISPFQYEGCR